MKKLLAIALLAAQTTFLHAAIVLFDLSPAGTDNAIGLSPSNEVPPVVGSSGSGNLTGTGITFDTTALTLNLSFGFSNLTGTATDVALQGPAPTNATAPVVIDLAGLNTPTANGGSVGGSVTLTTNETSDLLAGMDYVNVATAANTNGEIRGQLVPVDTLPILVCPDPTNAQCQGASGTPVTLTANVSDADGDALTVVWTANGVAVQTNTVPAGTSTNSTPVMLSGLFQFGTNIVAISVSDGIAPPVTCSTTVAVIDTIPPVITSASVSTNVLWPPNHKMVPVQISITATDSCGEVTTGITSITSSESPKAKGSGHTSPDFEITGTLSALLRAERSGKDKAGRVYTITVTATDEAGNMSETNLTVTVPHDQGKNDGNGNGNGKGNGNNGNGNGDGNGNGHGKGHNK